MKHIKLISDLSKVRVVPVIDPKQEKNYQSSVAAMIKGGATVLEVTLRSNYAFELFAELRANYPELLLGAGSVMSKEIFDKAILLGANFTVSPGRDSTLEQYAQTNGCTHIPGVLTPSEIISARAAGHKLLKFYPSEAAGGAQALKDLSRIFPDLKFMPSGGIKQEKLPGYSAVSGVASVGGSWMFWSDGTLRDASEIENLTRASILKMQENNFDK